MSDFGLTEPFAPLASGDLPLSQTDGQQYNDGSPNTFDWVVVFIVKFLVTSQGINDVDFERTLS